MSDDRRDVRRVVHDLNNALTIIAGELELLEASIDDCASNRIAMANLREMLTRCASLVRELL